MNWVDGAVVSKRGRAFVAGAEVKVALHAGAEAEGEISSQVRVDHLQGPQAAIELDRDRLGNRAAGFHQHASAHKHGALRLPHRPGGLARRRLPATRGSGGACGSRRRTAALRLRETVQGQQSSQQNNDARRQEKSFHRWPPAFGAILDYLETTAACRQRKQESCGLLQAGTK